LIRTSANKDSGTQLRSILHCAEITLMARMPRQHNFDRENEISRRATKGIDWVMSRFVGDPDLADGSD
jgi:hypothetical protein